MEGKEASPGETGQARSCHFCSGQALASLIHRATARGQARSARPSSLQSPVWLAGLFDSLIFPF